MSVKSRKYFGINPLHLFAGLLAAGLSASALLGQPPCHTRPTR